MNWAYLVIVLWMVGLLVVALMHDHDLRKGLKELETRNVELECRMRNMLEYMLQMNKNEAEMIKNVQEMAKTFKDIESQNYGEILNLLDDIREYSKSVDGQMESVGEAQMKVIEAVKNLEKHLFRQDFGSDGPEPIPSEVLLEGLDEDVAEYDADKAFIEELMKNYDNESNAIKAYIDWHRENPGKTHYLDREETFERSHKK